MSFFSYALGTLILIFVLLRQIRVRPVPRVYQPRLPVVIGVIGLIEMLSYAGDHHVSGSAWVWVLGTMLVGAVGLGALRGLSMRVWASNGWAVRQGNAVTMALWLVSLLVHFAGDAGGNHAGAVGLEGASFLLYLGLTLGVQGYAGAPPCAAAVGAARARRRAAAADPLHPGTGHLLRDLSLAGDRTVRVGTGRRGDRPGGGRTPPPTTRT